MKKISALFLVLIFVFSFVGCGTTTSEEIATTETLTLSHEARVDEIVQWAIVNIINRNSTYRFVEADLYEDVKKELELYIYSLPANLAPRSFSIELTNPGLFKIEFSF